MIAVADLLAGCSAFERYEHRDAMYKVAINLIGQHWGEPVEMADALGVLLLTWNQASYRYGAFDFDRLEHFIRSELAALESFSERRLQDAVTHNDLAEIERLFSRVLDALETSAGTRSPVGAAKALHLIAPGFLSVWDDRIAKEYGCGWYRADQAPERYVRFAKTTAQVLDNLGHERPLAQLESELNARARFPKTILKFVDEYNYAKFTKGWI